MSKKNIIIISHVSSLGGAERVLCSSIDALKGKYNIKVISNKRGTGELYNQLNQQYECYSVYFGLIEGRIIKTLIQIPLTIIAFIKLYFKLKKNNFDLIYTNSSVNILGILLAVTFKRRHVWHIHEEFGGLFNPRLAFIYSKLFEYKKNELVFISDYVKQSWEKAIPTLQGSVIRNPIALCDRKVIKKNFDKDRIVFGFAGTLVKNKNVILILEAIKKLSYTYTEFHLLIAGDGEEKMRLQNFCARNDLLSFVTFLGNVNNMENFYNQIDILILPSFTEGFPLVVLETASYNKMLLITKNSNINEVFDEITDYLSFDPNNYLELYSIMKKIIDSEYDIRKYSSNMYKKVLDYQINNNFSKKIIEII